MKTNQQYKKAHAMMARANDLDEMGYGSVCDELTKKIDIDMDRVERYDNYLQRQKVMD